MASSERRSAFVASAATRSIDGCSGPDPRRLIRRTRSPRSASKLAAPVPTGPEEGPVLDLRMPSAGEAAHDFGAQVGAPLVNMTDPFANLHEQHDSAVGHHVGGGRYALRPG